MGNLPEDMILAEFNRCFDLMIHYHSTQYQILKTFVTLHVAIWGAFILIQTSEASYLKNYILWIGILGGLLFLFIMISNRFYFIVMLRRIEFLRKKHLYVKIENWRGYPQFYSKALDSESEMGEKPKMVRFLSTSFLTIILVCFGNAALFSQIDFNDTVPWVQQNTMLFSFLVFFLFILITVTFAQYKQRAIEKHVGEK